MENNRPARLVWDSKIDDEKSRAVCSIREIERVIINPVYENQLYFEPMEKPVETNDNINNSFYFGDNLDLLYSLANTENERKIDLIYIDPPYMTELDYHSTISIGKYSDVRHINRDAFQDRWPGGLDSYLDMMYPRLQLMRQVLAEDGSIFVHVDWHASHYVRVLLDEIFGPENFINEITWCFGGGSNSRKYFHRKHDLIFWYARSSKYTFNPQYRPYTQGTLERGLTTVKGGRYKLNEQGALMQDWWVDINKILSPTARENLKFPTQKPKELIKRLVASASNPGSLVADFFAGSGTMAEVCNELGRNWILSDSSQLALQTSLYRLIKEGSPPFTINMDKNSPAQKDNGELVLKKPVVKETSDSSVAVNIGIEFYWPANIEKIPAQDFAEYIEFWEIDLDYNDKIFNSHYQIIRKNQRFKEPIALDLMFRSAKENFKIAIKVYDVYANQTMSVVDIYK